jgi:prephenate dehydrogenase
MPLFNGNFPDEVWSRLKAWAKIQASGPVSPTSDECVACVERIATEITGQTNSLRRDVVTFYAAETAEMIARFREQLESEKQLPSAAEA